MRSDTIFAPSSGNGAAGLAVIRISGPESGGILESLSGTKLPTPRYATRVALRDPGSGEALDDGLVLWFPGPASFTGEDVAELHIHGGRATVEAVSTALSGFEIAVVWRSRASLAAGRLTTRSSIWLRLKVFRTSSPLKRRLSAKQALRQLSGGISEIYERLAGTTLLRLLAHAEAAIDFPEEDLPDSLLCGHKTQHLGYFGKHNPLYKVMIDEESVFGTVSKSPLPGHRMPVNPAF